MFTYVQTKMLYLVLSIAYTVISLLNSVLYLIGNKDISIISGDQPSNSHPKFFKLYFESECKSLFFCWWWQTFLALRKGAAYQVLKMVQR